MQPLIRRAAGLDVHAQTVEATVRVMEEKGEDRVETRRFGTMTRNLEALAQWLAGHGVTHVAMESTGVYWKPIFNILEDRFTVLLCNARHIKHVPGRKTDVKDSQWIAQLLQCGLLSGSFIPPRAQRDLRDLTRHRAQMCGEAARAKNRIQKILEDCNIKLGEVASDPLGVSGRAMLKRLVAGEADAKALAELARRRMRGKIPQLRQALEGHVTEHHRYMLAKLLRQLEFLEAEIEDLDRRIEAMTASPELSPPPPAEDSSSPSAPQPPGGAPQPLGFDEAIGRMIDIPGIEERSARAILAEVGTNMKPFASHQKFASWARLCPGCEESAGKRKSVRTGKANRWLRRVMVQCAWAASRAKGSYFGAQFRQIAKRRGKKRAIIAVAHSILTTLYHMLRYHRRYEDLGGDFFDKIDPARKTRYHVRRLEELGHKVTLEAQPVAA